MKLMHALFSQPIVFRENCIPVLVLENPILLRGLTDELVRQSEGAEGRFVLSEEDVPLECASHLNVILDFVHIEKVEKHIQTKAINALIRDVQAHLTQETGKLSRIVQEYMGEVAALSEYPVDYDRSENLSALFKVMDLRIDLENLNACEALYERMNLIHSLSKDQCFVLVNAKLFFSTAELAQLYRMTQYRKLRLLLLEGCAPEKVAPYENVILYDADLCELRRDFPNEA